jgi:hypothetical protein
MMMHTANNFDNMMVLQRLTTGFHFYFYFVTSIPLGFSPMWLGNVPQSHSDHY